MRAAVISIVLGVAVSVTGAPSRSFADARASVATPGPAAINRGANDFDMPPEMVAKLSPEQILLVLRERESTRRPNVLLALVLFGTLAGTVLLAQLYVTRRERIRHETLRAMVDKGMDIPPDLIAKRAGPVSDLRRGLVLVGAGLGLSLVFAVVHLNGQRGTGLWSIGLIPILMGAGYLVIWRIESKNAGD